METGWWVIVTESVDDREAPAVGTSALLNEFARLKRFAGGWVLG